MTSSGIKRRKTKTWIVAVLFVICMAAFIAIYSMPQGTKTLLRKGEKWDINNAIARSNWKSGDFFQDGDVIALCDAIFIGDDQKVRSLIQRNPLLANSRGRSGFTILLWAYLAYRQDLLPMLLEAGASPDIPLEEDVERVLRNMLWKGDTIVFTAVSDNRNFDVFLDFVKEPNRRNRYGDTILHKYLRDPVNTSSQALLDLNRYFLQRMLSIGCDVNLPGALGDTPSILAIKNFPQAFVILVEAGGDPDVENENGESARSICNIHSVNPEFTPIWNWLEKRKNLK